jgi:hydroxymethylpyrimidine/phosphomethylpyrimidine kinase
VTTTVLTIAGSDSSGGAGLQADLAAIAECGLRGATVVTAVTAQGAGGVIAWEPVSVDLVRAQLAAALEDEALAAAKTGMLGTADVVRAVAGGLRGAARLPVVCDPGAAASSGGALLRAGGLEAIRDDLLPLVALVTPNAPEAEALAGMPVRTPDDAEVAGRRLLETGVGAVLVTGGHLAEGRGTDVLVTPSGSRRFARVAIDGPDVRGTGCALSAAIACGLARRAPLEVAVAESKRLVTARIERVAAARREAGA